MYFLHNDVESIGRMQRELQELVPEARIGVAHGQMPERELEPVSYTHLDVYKRQPLVTPLMMLGGAFLCFEGVEKLAHKFLHEGDDDRHAERVAAMQNENVDMVAFEKDKVRGAIRTDFILSAEIIVISLGTLAGRNFLEQVLTLVAISAIMTVGVYGLVGGIAVSYTHLDVYKRQSSSTSCCWPPSTR